MDRMLKMIKCLSDSAKWQIKISLSPEHVINRGTPLFFQPQFSQLYNGNLNKKINQSL